ncbi:MAG: GGDEF domain-containing protein [Alphaproteobacteria bacterium]|nr:GGDEF domain-containing protein [Alphaproteobacteria bacterium]
MGRQEGIGEAQDLATKALTFLGEQKLAPIPRHYTIAYEFFSGSNAGLNARITELVASQGLTADDMIALYDEFFGVDADSLVIRAAGETIEGIIGEVRTAVGAAGAEAASYGKELEAFIGKVAGEEGGGLTKAITVVLAETNRMRARNHDLEQSLKKSGDEISELRRSLDEMRLEALTDSLTGLANRKHFDRRFKELVEEAALNGEPMAVLMGDIDNFKSFNDTFGHQVGDHVLRLVAGVLSENVRGRDFIARYGGEEFAVVLPQTGLDGAVAVAENIRAAMSSKRLTRLSTGETLGTVSLSFGVAQYSGDEAPESFIGRADQGLLRAKRGGRDRIEAVTSGVETPRGAAPLAG